MDFTEGAITIRNSKANRLDVIPMHPQLAAELKHRRDETLPMPTAKVFPQAVTSVTVLNDLLRTELAKRKIVTDANGEPVMIGKGKRRRAKTRIVAEDAEGRVVDLHALRTTLGTNLARAGVAPQIAQRIMRHADYRTTLKHYTVLGLADTAKAIEELPTIQPDDRQAATGTCDAHARDSGPVDPQQNPQLYPQQLQRETTRNRAVRRDESAPRMTDADAVRPIVNADSCETTRSAATMRGDDAGVTQLVEYQPSKLNVVGSSPIARFPAPTRRRLRTPVSLEIL